MKVNVKRDKNKKFISSDLLNLSVKEQSKISIALTDYYYKILELKLSDADLVKDMLAELDVKV